MKKVLLGLLLGLFVVLAFNSCTKPTYTINVSSNDIESGEAYGGGTFTEGDGVTVSATANAGSEFVAWTENGNRVSSSSTYSFSATKDRNLVANFIRYCELNNYGSVKVTNSTGYKLWVDVTWGNVITNYEKLLNNGSSYTYNEIPAGKIEVWGAFSTNNWTYSVENLSVCEAMTFTWTLSNSKSTAKMLELINDQTGEVVRTVTIKSKSKY